MLVSFLFVRMAKLRQRSLTCLKGSKGSRGLKVEYIEPLEPFEPFKPLEPFSPLEQVLYIRKHSLNSWTR